MVVLLNLKAKIKHYFWKNDSKIRKRISIIQNVGFSIDL